MSYTQTIAGLRLSSQSRAAATPNTNLKLFRAVACSGGVLNKPPPKLHYNSVATMTTIPPPRALHVLTPTRNNITPILNFNPRRACAARVTVLGSVRLLPRSQNR